MPYVVHTGYCSFCNKQGHVTLTTDQNERFKQWRAGRNSAKPGAQIQMILRDVEPGLREQLMNGTHPVCFDATFPPEEE